MASKGWVNKGSWQTGWTSDTAHMVVGEARVHGNANHTLVKGLCGTNFNPGIIVDENGHTDQIKGRVFALCNKCQSGIAGKSVERKPKSEARECADCGERNTSKTSEFCSVCRPYHGHTLHTSRQHARSHSRN